MEINTYNDPDGWRIYEIDGVKYPSVTTILHNTVANPKLNDWFKKSSANKIEKTRLATSQFGSDGHEMFEKILKGIEFDCPDTHKTHVDSVKKWIKDNKVVAKNTEFVIYSKEYGYAGRVDCLLDIDGKQYIADWKLTARYDIKNGWQLGSYRRAAIEMGLIDENTGLMGLQVDRLTGELKTFKYEHIDFVEHAFMATLDVFKALYFHKLNKMEWKWLKERSV